MSRKVMLVLVLVLVTFSGCRFWQEPEPPGLDQVSEADDHQFVTADRYVTPHKDVFDYSNTKHLRAVEFVTLADGTDRIGFSVLTEEEELAQFPAIEVLYDEAQLQFVLNIYIGTQRFPLLLALDEGTVFSNYTLEFLHAPGAHGTVNNYRRLTLKLVGPVQYRLFWSESQRKLILDLQPVQ